MKKTYMKPCTLLTIVGVHQMICVSDPVLGIDHSGNVDADKVESRRGGLWDDEEE